MKNERLSLKTQLIELLSTCILYPEQKALVVRASENTDNEEVMDEAIDACSSIADTAYILKRYYLMIGK